MEEFIKFVVAAGLGQYSQVSRTAFWPGIFYAAVVAGFALYDGTPKLDAGVTAFAMGTAAMLGFSFVRGLHDTIIMGLLAVILLGGCLLVLEGMIPPYVELVVAQIESFL